MKTTMIQTRIPDAAHEKAGRWDGHRSKVPKSSIAAATATAAADPAIGYFCVTSDDYTLENAGGQGKYRSFTRGDIDHFAARNLWLGPATGKAETHLVAEVYDTGDAATRADLLTRLRRGLMTGTLVDTSTGTAAAPRTVVVGLVFCDFSDVVGGPIAGVRAKIEGPAVDGKSALRRFIERESNGRVSVRVAEYTPPAPAPPAAAAPAAADARATAAPATAAPAAAAPAAAARQWVRVARPFASYRNNFRSLLAEVDTLIEFPDDWDIAVFVFPDAGYPGGDANLEGSKCLGATAVDAPTGQKVNVVLINPTGYTHVVPIHFVTIHEVMHSLGLVDLYDSAMNRSYGWSAMSSAGAGWHITEFEKLLLGWRDPGDFRFLKRGLLPADGLLDGSIRGVIVLPDPAAGREDTIVIERAQEIGVGETERAASATALAATPGLLVLSVRNDSRFGRINPHVARRPAASTFESLLSKKGGASEAPFLAADEFLYAGICAVSTPNYRTDAKATVARVIGVDTTYRPPATAARLRERERLAATRTDGTAVRFELLPDGRPAFDGVPLMTGPDGALVDASIGGLALRTTDYGHSLYVDAAGALVLAASVDPKEAAPRIARRWPAPAAVGALTGRFVLTLAERMGRMTVAVHRSDGAGGAGSWLYNALTAPASTISAGWQTQDGTHVIAFDDAGNLKVVDTTGGRTQYRTGSVQALSLATVRDLGVLADGSLVFLDGAGTATKTFAGSATAKGPFAFRVQTRANGTTALALTDTGAAGATLYDVFSWPTPAA